MKESVLLTLQEVSELEAKSCKALRMQISRGRLMAIKIETGIKCGFEYRVPISELSETAQRKYFIQNSNSQEVPDITNYIKTKKKHENIEFLTGSQREDAYQWESIIRQWQEYISDKPKAKTQLTKMFVDEYNASHDKSISVRTLYDKYKLYKEYGTAGLADGRMSHEKKGRRIDERIWAAFLQWYLDENKLALSYIYENLREWIRLEGLDANIPSEATFRRAVEEIPVPVLKYFREGNKVFEDECLPYVVRRYENIVSNEFWSSDYHTLDMMVRDDITGEVYRPHLVTWIDIRSRKVLSLRLRRNSDSDGVILGFKDAVLNFGLPEKVYLDNGREYLVSDFGGRGKRKTDSNAFYGTGILERLDIKMINAKVRNGKAKVIERSFKQITSEFAKLFITYCGNRPGNRPERHNSVLKDYDNIPLASEVLKDLQDYINGRYNQRESEAEGLNGISPNECYARNLIRKRAVTEEQTNLLLLRNEKLQTVSRQGVFVTISSKKLWFFDADFVSAYMGQKVFVRYDPDKLQTVRVYNEHESFISVVDRMPEGGYEGAENTEAIKHVYAGKRKITKALKDFLENQKEIMEVPEFRDIVLSVAREKLDKDDIDYQAAVLNLHFESETKESYKAVANGDTIVDFNKMIANAKKSKGESENE